MGEEELGLIRIQLNKANEQGLGAEVVLMALLSMKSNSAITPNMAMASGLNELDIV